MAQVLVVADDLTGANATGARFARTGMRVATVTPEHVSRVSGDYDVVVANLDSRHVPVEQAADLVTDVVEAVWPVGLVVKRTDSTLRGNIGAELEAAYDAVRERVPAGTRVRVLFVPAFPGSGRITEDGVQLLNGMPLERTELAMDPLCPMTTSVVADILAAQTDLPVRHVPVRQVTQTMLTAELLAGDEPVVVCDASTEQHLTDIAEAAAAAHRTDGTVWVAADPGPTGALLAYALRLRGQAGSRGPLLGVVGSTTELTRRQLATVARTGAVRFVDVDAVALSDPGGDHADEVADELAEQLTSSGFPELCVLRVVNTSDQVRELPAQARVELPVRIARLVAEVVEGVADTTGAHALPSGLYLCGGDLVASLLDELDVHAFDVGGEIVPLAVHGHLSGGPLDGTPVVAKGGLVGDEITLVECLAKLRRAVQTRLHQVHSEVSEHVVPMPLRDTV
ncbi:Hrp-dependent type III effector protein [Nocardiopsis sp. TSRI0078]|uniref:four-carbon acid sugar kinase family protein n=1 Tax=unclassified Nocardiopsis TaxID=2649073 RepID=UPI0009391764|nr:four-carbon acid sugar kinase family protein [Nocardiopsis sp. TSRI0078]OKI19103.1 Hrp-dependent type III effector protein [Nocardiopsis sp. TSRI0078]